MRVLWRLKSPTRKGLEFGALLENFGGNGPKSNGVKRRDLVRVREMTVAFVATSIGFKEDNSCCYCNCQIERRMSKRPGEHGSDLLCYTLYESLFGFLPTHCIWNGGRGGETGHFFRKMVADSNAPVQDKALQREFPPCLSLPPAPCFNVLL
ncbi:hypothetical protein Tco_0688262 [Tanacetum coccineum]